MEFCICIKSSIIKQNEIKISRIVFQMENENSYINVVLHWWPPKS